MTANSRNITAEAEVVATQHVKIKCAGGWVYADVALHLDEVRRRRSFGYVEIPEDQETLDILLRVPLDGAVSEAVLSRRERDKLRRLGPGLVHFEVDSCGKRTVHRMVAPPASVQHVVVKGRNWTTALTQATRFAPYCRRSIILPSIPVDEEMLMLEARFYGVGVGIGTGSWEDSNWLLEPAPFTPERFTGASWKFAESSFEAWQSAQVQAFTTT